MPEYITAQVAGLIAVGLVFGYIGWQVYVRIRAGRTPIPLRAALFGIVALLVASVFAVAFHVVVTGGSPFTLGPGGTPHPSGSTPPNPSGGMPNGTGSLPFGSSGVPGAPFLSWADLGLLVLLIAVIAVAVLLFPRGDDPGRARGDDAAARRRAADLRAELERAIARLDADPDADPRALIIALYQRLLLRLYPRHGALEEMTPREIGTALVESYPVPQSDANELTGLFEEARYSTHRLGRPEADRARAVLGRVLNALTSWEQLRDDRLLTTANKSSVP